MSARLALAIVFAVLIIIAVVSSIAVHEERRERRKKNIRVPRETLWERTNRYHTKGN